MRCRLFVWSCSSTARIEASRGQVAVDALAREAGVSRKHLAALFRQQVGLGAKSLARVHRFRAAVALLAPYAGEFYREPGITKVEDYLGIENLYESLNTPLIGFLNNALNLLDVSSYYQMIAKASVILLAVMIDNKSK